MKKYFLFIFLFIFVFSFSSALDSDYYYSLNKGESIDLDFGTISNIKYVGLFNSTDPSWYNYISFLIKGERFNFVYLEDSTGSFYFDYSNYKSDFFNVTIYNQSGYNFEYYFGSNCKISVYNSTSDRVNFILSSGCNLYNQQKEKMVEIKDKNIFLFINKSENSDLSNYFLKANLEELNSLSERISLEEDDLELIEISYPKHLMIYSSLIKKYNIDLSKKYDSNLFPITLVFVQNKRSDQKGVDYFIKDSFVDINDFIHFLDEIDSLLERNYFYSLDRYEKININLGFFKTLKFLETYYSNSREPEIDLEINGELISVSTLGTTTYENCTISVYDFNDNNINLLLSKKNCGLDSTEFFEELNQTGIESNQTELNNSSNDSLLYDNQICSDEYCKYYNSDLGLEKCVDLSGLYYFVYENKSYQIFESGLPEMESFSRNANKMDINIKIIKFYEDGRTEVKMVENGFYDDSLNSSTKNEWNYQILPSNTKGLLTKDEVKIRFDLNSNNLIDLVDFFYNENEIMKIALMDSSFDEKNQSHSASLFFMSPDLTQFGIEDINSKNNDEYSTLNVFKDGSARLIIDGVSIELNRPHSIYQENLKNGKLLIFLKDYYLDGSESENYVDIIFLEQTFNSIEGFYNIVKCNNQKLSIKSFNQEEFSFLDEYDLRYTNCGENQCILEQKCYDLGYRKNRKYCSDERYNFVIQKGEGEFCDNNFECDSNLCIDEKCIGTSFLQKILDWFRKLFSTE